MNFLSRLFETADEERVRINNELETLRARVHSPQANTSSLKYGADAYAKDWETIGKLEKRLKKLNGKS